MTDTFLDKYNALTLEQKSIVETLVSSLAKMNNKDKNVEKSKQNEDLDECDPEEVARINAVYAKLRGVCQF